MSIEQEAADKRRDPPRPAHPPALNVPGAVLATIVLLGLVHAVRTFVLGPAADDRLVFDLAFIPGCYETDCVGIYGRAAGAGFWTPLTHAFLHGDWAHFGLNAVWLLAFGTPVARRIGARRYVLFSVAGALAGAGLFFLVNPALMEPVIGASGVVSALMGGACRFAFGASRQFGESASEVPLLPIGRALADRTVLVFILVFFATNLATATSFGSFISGGSAIAWEAHLGGFAFGFLCFGPFDRRRAA
ncbi:rhomboid family intramembrane serine protease [Aureimonas leprariae]|uniref:rhomboid family intramembrane serine protease n=1 Tax=Plantimonas leprariae TaxID=2615207 RepID=UPI001FE9A663|nr:rhomboid family intramembrane serine protease [Aureimonas leprariae]